MAYLSKFRGIPMLLLLVAALSVMLCSRGYAMPDKSCYTRDTASLIVEQFVTNEATYKYDGMEDTLSIQVENANNINGRDLAMAMIVMPQERSYTFKAKYDSRHSGYGDRAGKILAQVITPHEAKITVENCKVVSATMDGKWDMITEKAIET